jgi:hypothetical protein
MFLRRPLYIIDIACDLQGVEDAGLLSDDIQKVADALQTRLEGAGRRRTLQDARRRPSTSMCENRDCMEQKGRVVLSVVASKPGIPPPFVEACFRLLFGLHNRRLEGK